MSIGAKKSNNISDQSFILKFLSGYFFKVADKHAPAATKHFLNRKKLYIFPSLRGQAYIFIVIIIWLLGTNYQNNLIIGLAFFLTSIFVVSILATHANLSGLTLEYVGAAPAFAGGSVDFIFSLSSKNNAFIESIEVGWQNGEDNVVNIVVAPGDALKIRVPQQALARGWQAPGRMLIQSYYPLGILRCWSWLNWNVAALIYPEPMESRQPEHLSVNADGDGSHPVRGGEDYTGLRDYSPGDSLKHIAWKPFAQEKGLYVKEFSQNVSHERWLSFHDFPFSDPEHILSAICYWAVEFSNQDEFFGVELPGKVIEPDKGENHRRRVLEALAACEV